MTQEIKLLGNSTATVEIIRNEQDKLLVKKSCAGKHASRLLTQINKQKEFKDFEGIKTPKIFEVITSNDYTEFKMEYVNGLDFVSFTNIADKNDFIEVVQKIVKLINFEFQNSHIAKFPKDLWTNKVKQVIADSMDLVKVDFHDLEKYLIENIPENLLIGKCHGDLTFSNIIVEREKSVYTFDFLDPPVESPYEDAAKFLQDAQFFWSLQKFSGECDKTKVKVYWSFAAELLRNSLSAKCDMLLLKKFQLLGMLRIIPYTKDKSKLKFLESCLQGLLDDFNSTMCR